ncbi:MAG: flagellar biosynthesis repressor FlbT [Alphaproteobacteria bacterium]|nr:flagellar biosynthesis repressor FlbT [Alphaproteobacteria bacterium]
MPLKLSLKPHEKFVLNGAVLMNGDRRASLVIENKASILREKDIMQSEEADTPIKRIYFPIMMMYLDADASQAYYEEFVLRMTEFMNAVSNREALTLCVEISRDVLQSQYYRALMKCRKLFDFESTRLNYVPAGLSESATAG